METYFIQNDITPCFVQWFLFTMITMNFHIYPKNDFDSKSEGPNCTLSSVRTVHPKKWTVGPQTHDIGDLFTEIAKLEPF